MSPKSRRIFGPAFKSWQREAFACPQGHGLEFDTIDGYPPIMYRALPRVAAWLLLAAIVFVTVSPISMRPTLGLGPNVDRAAGFFAVGFAFAAAYRRRWPLVLAVVIASALLIEPLQLLTPDRHARLRDALVKMSGGMLGVATAYVLNWLRLNHGGD